VATKHRLLCPRFLGLWANTHTHTNTKGSNERQKSIETGASDRIKSVGALNQKAINQNAADGPICTRGGGEFRAVRRGGNGRRSQHSQSEQTPQQIQLEKEVKNELNKKKQTEDESKQIMRDGRQYEQDGADDHVDGVEEAKSDEDDGPREEEGGKKRPIGRWSEDNRRLIRSCRLI
jgi:hypothetical protein